MPRRIVSTSGSSGIVAFSLLNGGSASSNCSIFTQTPPDAKG
jgi:hypothetical protein